MEQRTFQPHRHGVFRHVLAGNKQPRFGADAQPLALADGVPRGPLVPADHMALLVYKIAGLHGLAGIALQKGGVIAGRHKADVLAVMLAGIAKPLFLGNGTHGVLVHAAQGEQRVGQLVLR